MSSLMAALLNKAQYNPDKPTIVVNRCPRYSDNLHQMVTKDGKPCKPRVYQPGEPRGTQAEVIKALRKKMRALPSTAALGAASTTAFDKSVVVAKCPKNSKTVSAAEYLRYDRKGQIPTVTASGEVCISYDQAVQDVLSGKLVAKPRAAGSAAKLRRDEIKKFSERLQKAAALPPAAAPPPFSGFQFGRRSSQAAV
jgi:hypothetical protein